MCMVQMHVYMQAKAKLVQVMEELKKALAESTGACARVRELAKKNIVAAGINALGGVQT